MIPVPVIRLSLAFRWRQGVIVDLIQDMVRMMTGETRHEGRLLWTDQIGAIPRVCGAPLILWKVRRLF